MNWSGRATEIAANRLPSILIGTGSLLGLVILVEAVLVFTAESVVIPTNTFIVGVLSNAPFVIGIVYGGYWLRHSRLDPSRYARIAGWCLASLVAFLCINLATIAVVPGFSAAETFAWIRWAVSIGAGVGLLIGVIEGRTIERAVTAERETLRSEHLESQRDLLDYLNSILRHEVLNTATVINGYASNLLEEGQDLDDDSRWWAEVIVSESKNMTKVIEDVRVLMHATDGGVPFERVELTGIVSHEVDRLRHTYGDVEATLTAPGSVYVRADDLLARVFGNLLSNAIEHNDSDDPQVDVTITTSDEVATIEIEDNGPGISERERESLFERTEARGSTHGLGLYLVGQLVDRYGGDVELAETGSDGSRFTIELPLADTSTERRTSELTSAPTSLARE